MFLSMHSIVSVCIGVGVWVGVCVGLCVSVFVSSSGPRLDVLVAYTGAESEINLKPFRSLVVSVTRL